MQPKTSYVSVPATDTKTCTKCGRLLSLGEFYFEHTKERHRPSCKECDKLMHSAWVNKNRKHANRYMRKYLKGYRAKNGDPTGSIRKKRSKLNKSLKRINWAQSE